MLLLSLPKHPGAKSTSYSAGLISSPVEYLHFGDNKAEGRRQRAVCEAWPQGIGKEEN